MRRFLFALGVLAGLGCPIGGHAQNTQLTNELDSLLSVCWVENGTSIKSQGEEVAIVREWFDHLGSNDKDAVLSILLERLDNASMQEENRDFIKAAEEYLLLASNQDELVGDVLEMLGKIYADQKDRDNLASVCERLQVISSESGQDFSKVLSDMDSVLVNLKPLSSNMAGIWVSDLTNKYGFPQYIIKIQEDNIAVLQPESKSKRIRQFNDDLRSSQGFEVNDNTGQFLFTYYSRHVSGGNNLLSSTMFEFSKETGRANAEYSAQKGVSFGDALGSAVGSAIIAGIFEGLGQEFAKARSTAYILSFNGKQEISGVLNTHLENMTVSATVDKDSQHVETETFQLLRVNPSEDHIVFGDFVPLWQDTATEEDKKELKRIMNKPAAYVIPLCALAVGGIGFAGYGMAMEFGWIETNVPNPKERGELYVIIGLGGSLLVTGVSAILAMTVGKKSFKEFNIRQMQKLKEKRGISVSITPGYDPITNTGGASIAMTF